MESSNKSRNMPLFFNTGMTRSNYQTLVAKQHQALDSLSDLQRGSGGKKRRVNTK